jgi:hypothetical protein
MAEKRYQTVRKLNPDFVPGDDEQWAWIMEYPLHFPGILNGDRICCVSVIQRYHQRFTTMKKTQEKLMGGPAITAPGNPPLTPRLRKNSLIFYPARAGRPSTAITVSCRCNGQARVIPGK